MLSIFILRSPPPHTFKTNRMITREEFEKTRQYGLEKLKDPEIRAVFMRLKDK